MRAFVFRAQAALDLRRRRDDEARRDLAAANAAFSTAAAALDASVAARDRALNDARDELARATNLDSAVWYRNWITGQQRDVARRQDELTERRKDADHARERATRTHVDVRVLEKLQQRARRTYDAAVAREEQKAIDWLAVLRSIPRTREQEGSE